MYATYGACSCNPAYFCLSLSLSIPSLLDGNGDSAGDFRPLWNDRHQGCVILTISVVPLLEGFTTNYFTIRGVQYYLIYYY
jgi:hypothetical protein